METRLPPATGEPGVALKVARRVSDVGNAVTFSLVVGIVFSFVPPQVHPPWLVFLLAFLIMIVAPALVLVAAMKLKGVDFDFTDRASRGPYYLAIEACYAAGLLVFSPLLVPSWSMFNLALVSTLLNGCLLLVNFKWKVSAHAAGSAGPMVGIAVVLGWWTLLFMVPVVVLVAWSRLVLGKHTPAQLVAGALLAMACYGIILLGVYPLFIW